MNHHPHALLAISDFSQGAEHALLRAVQLARQHRATLALAHLANSGPPDAGERLVRQAALLARRHRIAVHRLGSLDENELRAALAALPQIRLLLLAAPGTGLPAPRRLWPPWPGPRLARRLLKRPPGCPLLLVRRAPSSVDAAYHRLLLGVDPTPERALGLLQAASRLAPEAELELFHALDVRGEARLRAAEATPQRVRAYREALERHGRQHLLRLSDSLDTRRNRLMHTLGRGDPARQLLVQQERCDAELLLLGQRRRSLWQALLGGRSTAQRLLDRLDCDLLLCPEPAGAESSAQGRVCAKTQSA